MDGLTVSQAFEARELHAAGIWLGRISVLLGVEERLVRDALNGAEPSEDDSGEDGAIVELARPAPSRARAASWAPPVRAGTIWRTVVVLRTKVVVQVREVRLWGQTVLIDAAERVFCPCCRDFRSVAELGAPDNHCPVGIINSSPGPLPFDVEADLSAAHARASASFFGANW